MKFLFLRLCALASILALSSGCATPKLFERSTLPTGYAPVAPLPGEAHFKALRQVTFGGNNAEAYWSFSGRKLTLQHAGAQAECDQIFEVSADHPDRPPVRVSNGLGRTTCSYYLPNDGRILFSSTHGAAPQCPKEPDRSKGYVWPLYPEYQLYSARPDGTDVVAIELGAPKAYNAEATVCRDGKVVFTSDRDGDLELYTARIDRHSQLSEIKRITFVPGYDGGAFFSADCKKLVWRASRPAPGKDLNEYQALLKQHLVKPSRMEIWIGNADGSDSRQITDLGVASFAPFFTPDGNHILFASNPRDLKGRQFDIYRVKLDGTGLTQVTFSNSFDSFPMFSPDGRWLAFSSNRNGRTPHETNVFVAEWNELPESRVSRDDEDPQNRFMATVQALAAPEMEGRGVATKGHILAEDLVEEEFRKIGLEPFFAGKPDASFRQSVEMLTGVEPDVEKTRLGPVAAPAWKLGQDFMPTGFSKDGEFAGELVDAGYGLYVPMAVAGTKVGIDDYAGLDVRGKVVLVRRKVPKNALTPQQERTFGNLRYKAYIARERGAKAILFFDADGGEEWSAISGGDAEGDAGVAAFFIRHELGTEISHALKKGAFPVRGNAQLVRKSTRASNVAGIIGTQCARDELVVVGAHLDHLGLGSKSSLDPKSGSVVHPGADDNASGVAALIEIARILKKRNLKPGATRRSCYVLAAFTGEESGIVGSSRFAEYLKANGMQTKAMLNLDMVGRLEANRVLVFGTDTAEEWRELVDLNCGARGLTCPGGGDGYGPSDQMAFYLAGAPVLHFFTGPHADYHRSSDTPEKINATGGIQVARLVAEIAATVGGRAPLRLRSQGPGLANASTANAHATPLNPADAEAFAKAQAFSRRGAGGGSERRGFGAYLGTIPDYSQMSGQYGGAGVPSTRGVKLSGTRLGSPAEKAGILPGDVLVSIDDHAIQNLEDMMAVLTTLQPGQEIDLEVKRNASGDERLKLKATVGKKD